MRNSFMLVLVLVATALPAQARSQGETGDGPAAAQDGPAQAADAGSAVDPLTRRMRDLVARYHAGVGVEASGDEIEQGVQSIQYMLLDGVSLARIEAAVAEAVRLNTPGRRIPFSIAVPLRVRPEAPGDAGTEQPSGGDLTQPLPLPEAEPAPAPREVELDERRAELRRQRDARQQRAVLYRQWRERTAERRMLMGIGIPMLAANYAIGFAVAGGMALDGSMPYYSSWVAAVPVAGTLVLGIWAEGTVPGLFVLFGGEVAGVSLIVASLVRRIDWPHEEDPTALRIGRRRDGRPALTLRVVPAGAGGVVLARF